MSDNEQKNENCETIADVIAIVREIVKFYEKVAKTSKGQLKESFVLTAKNYRMIADLIEAAWARESKAIATENAVLPAVCITKPSGNAAAMRDALLNIQEYAAAMDVDDGNVLAILDACRDALSAPARNCDRFNTGDPMKDAEDAYDAWQRYCDDPTIPPSCKIESAFKQWLFAPAAERKGDGDGR
jgi:hypothetical protein